MTYAKNVNVSKTIIACAKEVRRKHRFCQWSDRIPPPVLHKLTVRLCNLLWVIEMLMIGFVFQPCTSHTVSDTAKRATQNVSKLSTYDSAILLGLRNTKHTLSSSGNRIQYLQSRSNKFLELLPDGQIRFVYQKTPFCVITVSAENRYLVMQSYVNSHFLCMNYENNALVMKERLVDECYMEMQIRGIHYWYTFTKCRETKLKTCFLRASENNTSVHGTKGDRWTQRLLWINIPLKTEELQSVDELKLVYIKKKLSISSSNGFPNRQFIPISSQSVHVNSSKKEAFDYERQERKHTRRWCRIIVAMLQNKQKYLSRCKHYCDSLRKMLNTPKRSVRRCLFRYVRDRAKNRKQRALGVRAALTKNDHAKVRQQMKRLWPRRHQLFKDFRRLRRCNRRRLDRKDLKRCTWQEAGLRLRLFRRRTNRKTV